MVDLKSIDTYKATVLKEVEAQLRTYFGDLHDITVEDVARKAQDINKYPNLSFLRNPESGEILVMEEGEKNIAEKTILSGRFFTEHTAAGEATRLGLGTKYLLNLSEFSINRIRGLIIQEFIEDQAKQGEKKTEVEAKEHAEKLLGVMDCDPKELEPLTFGHRHMLQMAFDLVNLARKHNFKGSEVLAKQKLLIILNEETAGQILKEFEENYYYGFKEDNIHFMIQQSFHGISMENGTLFFDEQSLRRLHNHGQMMMQKCHDNSIFVLKNSERVYKTFKEYLNMLQGMDDMLSYNIEDIGYLSDSVDLASLGFALKLGSAGYQMVMEVVAQNPFRPQKGGACFYDQKLGRVVMVETNRLGGIKYEEIKYLNKNFNHYPQPPQSLITLKQQGLDISFEVKESGNKPYIYPCPIQGDLNFKVPCAFVMRKVLKPISNLKSPATMPAAIMAMKTQDEQDGFLEFADKLKEGL